MSVRKVRDAAVIMVAFLALLWILQVFNWADGYRLDTEFGILPHHVSRLPDIFAAPFLRHPGFSRSRRQPVARAYPVRRIRPSCQTVSGRRCCPRAQVGFVLLEKCKSRCQAIGGAYCGYLSG